MDEELYISVKVEGEELSDLLDAVEVEESDSRSDRLSLRFTDSHLVLSDILHEGLVVEVDLGRRDVHSLIFRGPITGVEGRFPADGTPQVEIEGADHLIQLSLEPRTRHWWNTTVSQVVREIALDHGLVPGEVVVEDDDVIDQTRPLQQVEETDLALLYRLAEDYDTKLFLEHEEKIDRLSFVSTRHLLEEEPVEQPLVFNANLGDFTACFNAFATSSERKLVTTDPESGERVQWSEELVTPEEGQWVPDADRIARTGPGAVRLAALLAKSAGRRARLRELWRRPPREAGTPARPATDRARTRGDHARRLGQTARGRAVGNIWLRPRRRVCVLGYGGRWSGFWYLARVSHQLDLTRRLYVSSFVCTR